MYEGTLAFLGSTGVIRADVCDGDRNWYWMLGDDFAENGVPVPCVLYDDVDDALLAIASPSSIAINADFTP